MKTFLLFAATTAAIFLSGCVNRHGISIKYYSDCKEYYDVQGYYHKECGKDDVITYKEINKALKKEQPKEQRSVY